MNSTKASQKLLTRLERVGKTCAARGGADAKTQHVRAGLEVLDATMTAANSADVLEEGVRIQTVGIATISFR